MHIAERYPLLNEPRPDIHRIGSLCCAQERGRLRPQELAKPRKDTTTDGMHYRAVECLRVGRVLVSCPSNSLPHESAWDMNSDAKVKVIYIAGYGRSGSTILDIALSQAREVFGAGEITALSRHVWTENEYCACGVPIRSCELWQAIVARWAEGEASDFLSRYHAFQRLYEFACHALLAESRAIAGICRVSAADGSSVPRGGSGVRKGHGTRTRPSFQAGPMRCPRCPRSTFTCCIWSATLGPSPGR